MVTLVTAFKEAATLPGESAPDGNAIIVQRAGSQPHTHSSAVCESGSFVPRNTRKSNKTNNCIFRCFLQTSRICCPLQMHSDSAAHGSVDAPVAVITGTMVLCPAIGPEPHLPDPLQLNADTHQYMQSNKNKQEDRRKPNSLYIRTHVSSAVFSSLVSPLGEQIRKCFVQNYAIKLMFFFGRPRCAHHCMGSRVAKEHRTCLNI